MILSVSFGSAIRRVCVSLSGPATQTNMAECGKAWFEHHFVFAFSKTNKTHTCLSWLHIANGNRQIITHLRL